MKPARFEYDDPATLGEALDLLAEHGEGAQVLAGGQSLVPLLSFRLAQPERLVDLNGVRELDYIRVAEPSLRIGAITRQATLERSPEVAERVPLITEAAGLVGHAQIRNRGTVGGSVAHADPAAELPSAFAALDARFHLRTAGGRRTIGADELFRSHYVTSLEPDELLVEVEVPIASGRRGSSFVEIARRDGDFALAGAAASVAVADDGACEQIGRAHV